MGPVVEGKIIGIIEWKKEYRRNQMNEQNLN